MGQTVLTIKFEMTTVAGQTGSAESVVIGAGVVVSITGSAGPSFAGMVRRVVVIEAFVAQVAPVRPVDETSEGFTPFEMVAAFQESKDMGRFWAFVNNKERLLPAHDLQLVRGSQVLLELVQFGQTAGTFRHACGLMKLFGHLFLTGSSLT